MDLKKRLKRFFTLSRKADGGFTLVELIVVIAIIAILGGVAVPAYSGYVTKANKQADISLVSDIEHALTLAGYSGTFDDGDSGYIFLTSASSAEDMLAESPDMEWIIYGNEKTVEALRRSFGDNWAAAMQLKYDNWGVKSQTMSQAEATTVLNSNFVQKYSPSELMEQVQIMTNAANGLKLDLNDTTVKLYDSFGYQDSEGSTQNAIIDVMKKYNIGEDEEDWNNLTDEQKSNVLVLATADSVSSGTNAYAVDYLTEYSRYTAYAAEGDESFNTAYATFQDSLAAAKQETDADAQYNAIKSAYQTLQSAANGNSNFKTWNDANKDTSDAAFLAVMNGVGNAMKDNGDAIIAQLDDPNLFTSGVGSEMYNDYLKTAYATVGLKFPDGVDWESLLAIAGGQYGFTGMYVYYSVVNGAIIVDNTIAQ